jgi:hypothetical protein
MKLNSRIHFTESEDRFSFKCLVQVMYGACQTALFYRRTDCSLYGELSQTGANKSLCVSGFEILTAVATKSFIFCSRMLCGPLKFNWRFKGNTASVCSVCSLLHVGFLLGILFDPEDGADMFHRKVRLVSRSHKSAPCHSHVSAVSESFG